MILLNDIDPKNWKQFFVLKRCSDRLDSFYAGHLEEKEEVEALQKVFKVIHGLSTLERGFKADGLFTVENQSELSLKTLRIQCVRIVNVIQCVNEKCPYSELFWSVLSLVRTKKTPNTGTFYSVSPLATYFTRALS